MNLIMGGSFVFICSYVLHSEAGLWSLVRYSVVGGPGVVISTAVDTVRGGGVLSVLVTPSLQWEIHEMLFICTVHICTHPCRILA